MAAHVYTHKGWFGLCPIYIGGLDDHNLDGPCLKARHWTLEWLLDLSAWMQDLAMHCVAMMGGVPPGYCIKVGPELDAPIIDEPKA